MEMLQLKYFKAVAEMGKISAAAESLFISAPALSAAVSRLEKDLGMPLFDRTNNKITLNRQGQIFLQGVNRIFLTLESTRGELERSLRKQGDGKLALCMISSTQWVELIAAYSQRYPEVELSCEDVKPTALELGGLPGRYDFLLAVQEDVPDALAGELEQLTLMEDQPVIMVSPRHPLAKREAVELRELARETVFLPMEGYPVRRYLKDMFREAGLVFPEENAHSHLMAQQMAAKGLGVGFSSLQTVRIGGPELCYVPIRSPRKSWKLCLYRRKEAELLPEERAFIEFAMDYCSQHNIDVMQAP